ncbi:ROK family protein [Kiritimatiellaeota bacterium B1221]|nr:ROK family protein [Kiritimatiellaeota bacterium B1221]
MKELLLRQLVETLSTPKQPSTGRPSTIYQLAREKIQFLGLVIDIEQCRIISAGLDGKEDPKRSRVFATPQTYADLITTVSRNLQQVAALKEGAEVLGVGVSVPGLIDESDGRQVLSPNVHFMDGCYPARDIANATGYVTQVVQEEKGLCLAEQLFGQARDLDDFAMIDISAGVGLGVINSGRFINGTRGFAGELGHITIAPNGLLCGCGNRGCLETVASDVAFSRLVMKKYPELKDLDDIIEAGQQGVLNISEEHQQAINALAIGMGVVINLFNPSDIFVYGRLFDVKEGSFDGLLKQVRNHAIGPSMDKVSIVRARGSKRLGALAAIIEYHMDTLAPRLG